MTKAISQFKNIFGSVCSTVAIFEYTYIYIRTYIYIHTKISLSVIRSNVVWGMKTFLFETCLSWYNWQNTNSYILSDSTA